MMSGAGAFSKAKTNLFLSLRKKKEEKASDVNKERKKDDNYFAQRRQKRGSDPRLQTCRGKLQSRRSKINLEINKELMLRNGAENLFNATNNKRMKEAASMEIQFFNSNLQLLKEQLAELNSSVEIYQGNSPKSAIPMIPLGLKETKEINFRDPLKDFIREHYSEQPSHYDSAITELIELREAMRTPERDESGVALLFEYYNQLYYIDRRFFPPDRSLGIFFEWYDSLTGTPSCQRTVAFEKACVLFNLGSLYTQLGTRHDRTSCSGLDAAVNCFLRAAGVFRYLQDNFTNAPSKDLSPEVLEMLIQLMLAQARECLHEKYLLTHSEDVETLLEISMEAMQVSYEYSQVFGAISAPSVKDYVPPSWVSMVHIKSEHYRGRAHYHVSEALLAFYPDTESDNEVGLSQKALEILGYLHVPSTSKTVIDFGVPKTRRERTLLGLSHGRESVLVHEEALRLLRMCRDLRKRNGLSNVLQLASQAAIHLLEDFDQEEDQLLHIFDPMPISPSTKVQLSLACPDFSVHKVEDIFRRLGPVAVFSAKHRWSLPRPVSLTRTAKQGFGFSVRGDAPVVIAGVDRGGLAERAGMKEGDLITTISGRDVKWMPHDEVVSLIRACGNSLCLTLVTLYYKDYPKLVKSKSLKDISPHSTTSSSSSGVSSNSSSSSGSGRSSNFGSVNSSSTISAKDKRASWNPFKRTMSRDKLKAESLNECSSILR